MSFTVNLSRNVRKPPFIQQKGKVRAASQHRGSGGILVFPFVLLTINRQVMLLIEGNSTDGGDDIPGIQYMERRMNAMGNGDAAYTKSNGG